MKPGQVTIGRLMVAIAGIAAILPFFRSMPGFLATLLATMVPLVAGYLASRVRPERARMAYLLGVGGLSLDLLVWYAYLPLLGIGSGFAIGLLVLFPAAIGFGGKWAASRPDLGRAFVAAVVAALLFLVPLSMLATRWPLHLAFYASSPALNRLADRFEAGGSVTPGEWAGLYRVWGARPMRYPATLIVIGPATGTGSGFLRWAGPPRGGQKDGLGPRWSDHVDDWFR